MGCTSLTSVVISDSVTEIGDYAFQSTGLTSIEIPNSVKRIGEGAFWGCAGLTSIVISDSVTEIVTNAFDGCSGLRQASILGPVKKINWLFRNCSALETVTFGVGIDGFDEDMFKGCESLKAIYVPAKKTDYYARRLYALPHGNSLCKLIVELPAEKKK